MRSMKICPNCHVKYEDKVVLCDRCGSELQEAVKPAGKKTTHGFFDRCEEIEDQAICKKSEVKFYPDKGF